jgi:hypothetical protein
MSSVWDTDSGRMPAADNDAAIPAGSEESSSQDFFPQCKVRPRASFGWRSLAGRRSVGRRRQKIGPARPKISIFHSISSFYKAKFTSFSRNLFLYCPQIYYNFCNNCQTIKYQYLVVHVVRINLFQKAESVTISQHTHFLYCPQMYCKKVASRQVRMHMLLAKLCNLFYFHLRCFILTSQLHVLQGTMHTQGCTLTHSHPSSFLLSKGEYKS